MTDAELAAHLAGQAGRILLEVRDSRDLHGDALGRAGDLEANAVILAALRELRPDDGILSEEAKDNPVRLTRKRVWIVDPLDGTREFCERREDWAVHVALAVDGIAAAGAVALPARGVILHSDAPAALPPAPGRPRIVVSRTRPPAEASRVAERLGAELVALGSAGAKAMAVVLGDAEIYVHAGGQHQWDNCAPVAVAQAHGLHCSRLDGSPMRYNGPDTMLPDLLICRSELAQDVLDALRN